MVVIEPITKPSLTSTAAGGMIRRGVFIREKEYDREAGGSFFVLEAVSHTRAI